MFNTLLLREHNRLAGELEERNPGWDDTRVFETARNIVIVLFIKLVVEEYINHIASIPFPLKAYPSAAWDAPFIDGGLRQGFADMSAQKTGVLGPFNTTDALLAVERVSIQSDPANLQHQRHGTAQ